MNVFSLSNHGTIIQTGITCEKIPCYMRDSACSWCIVNVGLSPSKNCFCICFNDSSSKMMKNAFYFILKALFVLKMFKFLSCYFGHAEKTA